jgi:hypothetical protein
MRKKLLLSFFILFTVIGGGLIIAENYFFNIDDDNFVDTAFTSQSQKFMTENEYSVNDIKPNDYIFRASENPTDWERENKYLDQSTFFHGGYGPDLITQHPKLKNGNKLNILLVGDSFVYGEAIENSEIRWERMMQYYLDKLSIEKYNKKLFNVIPIGRGASSFNNYLEWVTDERLKKYNADAVVFQFLGNDDYPSFTEKKFCRELNTCTEENQPNYYGDCGPRCLLASCLLGESSFFGTFLKNYINPYFPNTGRVILERYCDPDKINQRLGLYSEGNYINNREGSPYFDYFTDNVVDFGKEIKTKSIPFYFYQPSNEFNKNVLNGINDISQFNNLTMPSIKLLLDNNFDIIERKELFNFYKSSISELRIAESLYLNPLDKHPNGLLTSRYGMDTANEIFSYFENKETFTFDFLAKFENYAPKFEISNYLPQSTYLTKSKDKYTFTHNINDFYINTPEYYHFLKNNKKEGQYFPCARVNHPHTRHIFTRDVFDLVGEEIKITAIGAKDLYLLPIGIDADGKEFYFNSFKLTALAQSNLNFIIPEHFIGFILIDNSKKCEDFLDNQLLVMNSYTISYELI